MKTAEEILQYIERLNSNGVRSPIHYFRDVNSMQGELTAMEALYEFILDDERKEYSRPTRYLDFLQEKGYGACGYEGGVRTDDEVPKVISRTAEEIREMDEFAVVWNEYLASGKRMTSP